MGSLCELHSVFWSSDPFHPSRKGQTCAEDRSSALRGTCAAAVQRRSDWRDITGTPARPTLPGTLSSSGFRARASHARHTHHSKRPLIRRGSLCSPRPHALKQGIFHYWNSMKPSDSLPPSSLSSLCLASFLTVYRYCTPTVISFNLKINLSLLGIK